MDILSECFSCGRGPELRADYETPQISSASLDPSSVVCDSGDGSSEGFGFEDWSA